MVFLFLYKKTVLTGGTEKESFLFLKEKEPKRTFVPFSREKKEPKKSFNRETAFRSGL